MFKQNLDIELESKQLQVTSTATTYRMGYVVFVDTMSV